MIDDITRRGALAEVGMNRRISLLGLASMSASCVVASNVPPFVEDEERMCAATSECVAVETDCDCSEGGSRTAVNVSAVDAIDARRETAFCGAVESRHPSCQASTVSCVAGRCELLFP